MADNLHTYLVLINIFEIGTIFICIKADLKYTQGSNIRRVVQQNERSKHLGPFKCRVPKLLNLIN